MKTFTALTVLLLLPATSLLAIDAAPAAQLTTDEILKLRALLHASDNGDDLTPKQVDSVRGLIKETNADADFISAGFDNKGKLFFKTQDEQFFLNVGGLIQARYTWNYQDGRGNVSNYNNVAASDSVNAFSISRGEIGFEGKAFTDFFYTVKLQKNSGANTVEFQDIFAGYQASEKWSSQVGYFRVPFGRENLLGNGNQVGVERSLSANRFDLSRAEGLQLQYLDSSIKARAALHNQTNSGLSGFLNTGANGITASSPATDAVAIATTERLEFLALGKWDDVKDNYASAASDTNALLFGGSVNYTQYSSNFNSTYTLNPNAAAAPTSVVVQTKDSLALTLDTTYKLNDWAFFGAAYGVFDNNSGPNKTVGATTYRGSDENFYGLTGQVDYRVFKQWDVFARYDWLTDGDDASPNTTPIQAITTGVNFQPNSKVRVSGDVVYVLDGDAQSAAQPLKTGNEFGNNLGLITPPAGHSAQNQFALRVQVQVAF